MALLDEVLRVIAVIIWIAGVAIGVFVVWFNWKLSRLVKAEQAKEKAGGEALSPPS